MSLYLEQIKQLISLQKVDDEIFSLRKELENGPKALESLRAEFADVTARHEHQIDKMSHLHEQEKRLGIEIEDESTRIKRSKNKMMQAGNAKEYNAMIREMDSLERMNRDREDEKTTLIEELALQTTLQEELNEQFEKLEKEVTTMGASLKKTTTKAENELAALGKRRATCAKDVPAPILSRYEFIRERLSHPVIISVTAGVCSGCHIAIPPQCFIELQKGTQIISCPNCQRLIYWEEHFTPKAD